MLQQLVVTVSLAGRMDLCRNACLWALQIGKSTESQLQIVRVVYSTCSCMWTACQSSGRHRSSHGAHVFGIPEALLRHSCVYGPQGLYYETRIHQTRVSSGSVQTQHSNACSTSLCHPKGVCDAALALCDAAAVSTYTTALSATLICLSQRQLLPCCIATP